MVTDQGASGPPRPGSEGEPLPSTVPFDGFELGVLTDRRVYAPGETVRITVTATNHGGRFVEHHYPGWQRFVVSVRDEYHRAVADDELDRTAASPAVDRWLPGQVVIWPLYWNQQTGPLVPAWIPGTEIGSAVEPGRFRVRVTWLGREPGLRGQSPEAWSRPFELT